MSGIYLASNYLKHTAPFLFVDQFTVSDEGIVDCTFYPDKIWNGHNLWLADEVLSLVAVEYAAQLMGAGLMAVNGSKINAGFLSTIRSYTRLSSLMNADTIRILPYTVSGSFYTFKTLVLGKNNIELANMEISLYLSSQDKLINVENQRIDHKINSAQQLAPLVLQSRFGTIINFKASENEVVLEKCFSREIPVYAGHFPENPITPGILIAESLIETSVMQAYSENSKMIMELDSVFDMVFQSLNFPDIVTTFKAKLIDIDGIYRTYSVSALCNGKRCARGKVRLKIKLNRLPKVGKKKSV